MSESRRQRLSRLSQRDIVRDVDLMLWSFRLHKIRRWVHQPYWRDETMEAIFADRLESYPRLETVAEHSWAVTDSVILLAPNFPYLHRAHAVELAVLHDKMEIAIGDLNPLGRDGTGERGHAFNIDKQLDKHRREMVAIESYASRLRAGVAEVHRALLIEGLRCETPEARFVKAIDKMQALAFILLKKNGQVEDKHLRFLIRFTEKNDRYFPPLRDHSQELLRRIFRATSEYRKVAIAELWAKARTAEVPAAEGGQLDLLEFGQDLFTEPMSAEIEERSPEKAPPKSSRLKLVLEELMRRPAARTGLEAYRQISDALNRVEDMYWGAEHWQPPRHVGPGTRTDRMYPIAPESIYPVADFCGVDLLATVNECIFVSRFGAIEIQLKDSSDLFERRLPYYERVDRVILAKSDASGDGVWHAKNRD